MATCAFETTYRTGAGWVGKLTIHADSGAELFKTVDAALELLEKRGAKPVDPFTAPTAAAVAANLARAEAPGPAGGPGWCPIHGCDMTLNQGQDGRSWYSHKTADGWCKGKPRNGSGR